MNSISCNVQYLHVHCTYLAPQTLYSSTNSKMLRIFRSLGMGFYLKMINFQVRIPGYFVCANKKMAHLKIYVLTKDNCGMCVANVALANLRAY
jgi:hypothetical protein